MKVFFNASLKGKSLYEDNYEKIGKTLEQLGFKIIKSPVLLKKRKGIPKETIEERVAFYKKLVKWITNSNICVFETSYPSIGIGHEMAIAADKRKPVIALHVENKPLYILMGKKDEKLQIVEYSLDDLEIALKHALDNAKKMVDTRFTLLFPSKIINHLNKIAKTGTARSEYIRMLIEKDMKRIK